MDCVYFFQVIPRINRSVLGESFGGDAYQTLFDQGAVVLDPFHLFRVVPSYMTGVLTYKVVHLIPTIRPCPTHCRKLSSSYPS
jgi:hypothetical protein